MSADSASDAWAAGESLLVHWNGKTWAKEAKGAPAAADLNMEAVKAFSKSDAWAVGQWCSPACQKGGVWSAVILHWNGTTWSRITSPVVTPLSELTSVAGISASNVWAAGDATVGPDTVPVILHWNGKTWSKTLISLPEGADGAVPESVSPVSSGNAWAAGYYMTATGSQGFTLHWNGKAWTPVASPDPNSQILSAVSATSAESAWATGSFLAGAPADTLMLHWNGTRWAKVAVPSSAKDALMGIADVSATNAWAVGKYYASSTTAKDLILHWSGKAWSQVPSPSPAKTTTSVLLSVSVLTAGSAWAVGEYFTPTFAQESIILHWNGKTWS